MLGKQRKPGEYKTAEIRFDFCRFKEIAVIFFAPLSDGVF